MDIALLNTRIQIQQSRTRGDELGNRVTEWKEVYACYATVTEETGQEKTTEIGVVENQCVNFTVRYCKAMAKVTATDYRVLFHGDIYNILAVNHMNYKKKSIKLRCQRVRR